MDQRLQDIERAHKRVKMKRHILELTSSIRKFERATINATKKIKCIKFPLPMFPPNKDIMDSLCNPNLFMMPMKPSSLYVGTGVA